MKKQEEAFSKELRLHHRHEIQEIRNRGQKKIIPPWIIYRLPQEKGYARLAIAITRQAGNSVIRNRSRRVMREYFRKHKTLFGSFDYFFFTARDLQKTKVDWPLFFEKLKSWL